MLHAILYLIIIAAAEFITVLVSPQLGVLIHSCLLVALLLQGATTTKILQRRFLLVMALVPLIRIISTTLPLGGRPLLEWHVVIGALLFVAIYFTIRAVQLDGKRIGLHLKGWRLQVSISLLGIPFGYFEYLILKPAALITSWNLAAFLDAALVLLVFTGVLEEVIFRGLMQEVTTEMMGLLGIVYCAAVFMVMHAGYKSVADLVFVFGVALLFGICVAKTHSLLGVSLAHGWINIFLYLVFPLATSGSIYIPGITKSSHNAINVQTPTVIQPTDTVLPTPLATPTPIAITPQSRLSPFQTTGTSNAMSAPSTDRRSEDFQTIIIGSLKDEKKVMILSSYPPDSIDIAGYPVSIIPSE